MRSRSDGNTVPPSAQPSDPVDAPEASGAALIPTRVFDDLYLRLLAHRDEPYTGSEADVAGPWHLEKTAEGYAVLRQGESLRRGDLPYAVFTSEDTAQLCAAVLPATGRTGRYVIVPHPDTENFPVLRDNEPAGHLPLFDPDLIAAMNVADAVISSPDAFAWLLDAAGGLLLDRAGKIALDRALA